MIYLFGCLRQRQKGTALSHDVGDGEEGRPVAAVARDEAVDVVGGDCHGEETGSQNHHGEGLLLTTETKHLHNQEGDGDRANEEHGLSLNGKGTVVELKHV